MPDSYLLTPPGGGTSIEIGTYAIAERVDFGSKDLLKAGYVEGPHTDGALAIEEAVVRRMSFPLMMAASRSMPLGLFDQEALLRKAARPGAVLDLQPQGATTAVRFDVLGGRFEFDYNIHHNRQGIRVGTLELETKPYGYWPTMILLASVASVALPGALTWTGSIIGDAPGLAKIVVQPTVASNIPAGSWMTDFAALAVSHRASHLSHLRPPSLAFLDGASLLGEALAPASQSVRYAASQMQGDWKQITRYVIASALEPAYRGRYRAFGWFRVQPSQALPWRVALDATPEHLAAVAALGSYAPVATIALASPAYELADLGEITLPAVGSGMGGGQAVRVWMAPATVNVGVASPVLGVGGIFLQPLDSDFAGIVPRGLAVPSLSTPSAGRLVLDSEAGQAVLSGAGLNLATAQPWLNAWRHYRGLLPGVASGVRLDLLSGVRRTVLGDYVAVVGSDNPKAQFRFEESAGPTLVDSRGSWHGSYVNAPSLGQAGVVGCAGVWAPTDNAQVASLLHAWATSWTIEAWARRDATPTYSFLVTQGPVATGTLVQAYYTPFGALAFGFGEDDTFTDAIYDTVDAAYHHLVFAYDYVTRRRAIFRDGMLAASSVALSTYRASGPIFVGRRADGQHFTGALDEIAFYVGTALDEDVALRHYRAGAPDTRIMHSAPAFASVSVAYRPRFQFMKGL